MISVEHKYPGLDIHIFMDISLQLSIYLWISIHLWISMHGLAIDSRFREEMYLGRLLGTFRIVSTVNFCTQFGRIGFVSRSSRWENNSILDAHRFSFRYPHEYRNGCLSFNVVI